MLNFITAHGADIIVGVVVLAIVTMIVVKMIRDKKNNKFSCSGACAGCKSAVKCHHNQ